MTKREARRVALAFAADVLWTIDDRAAVYDVLSPADHIRVHGAIRDLAADLSLKAGDVARPWAPVSRRETCPAPADAGGTEAERWVDERPPIDSED